MGYYIANLGNATLTGSQTEDLLAAVFPPATVSLRIKKVKLIGNIGTSTTLDDRPWRIAFKSFTGNSTGGIAFTVLKTDGNMPTPLSTAKQKQTTNAHTIGSVTATFFEIIQPFSNVIEWNAMDREDEIVCKPGENFGVTGKAIGGPSIIAHIMFSEQSAAG